MVNLLLNELKLDYESKKQKKLHKLSCRDMTKLSIWNPSN